MHRVIAFVAVTILVGAVGAQEEREKQQPTFVTVVDESKAEQLERKAGSHDLYYYVTKSVKHDDPKRVPGDGDLLRSSLRPIDAIRCIFSHRSGNPWPDVWCNNYDAYIQKEFEKRDRGKPTQIIVWCNTHKGGDSPGTHYQMTLRNGRWSADDFVPMLPAGRRPPGKKKTKNPQDINGPRLPSGNEN